MDGFWTIAVVSFLVWCITTDIIYLILRLTKLYTCRKITDCKNRKCLVSDTCRKYNKFLTEEEYNYLMNLLYDMFKEDNTQNEKR